MMNIKKTVLLLAIILFQIMCANAATNQVCPNFPFIKPDHGILAEINCNFHKHYEERIAQISKQFGSRNGIPLIINLGGTLILKYNDETIKITITRPIYHELKTYLHAGLSVASILLQSHPGSLNKKNKNDLIQLRNELIKAGSFVSQISLNSQDKQVILNFNAKTLGFINQCLSQNNWNKKELKNYYKKSQSELNKIISLAANSEIESLDKAIGPWLKRIPLKEKNKILIVVATAHQARTDETSLQYFEKKFNLKKIHHPGAIDENRLIVIEDNFNENSVLPLLARHYFDRELGNIMFDEVNRLQRDVLSDAAAKKLN